MTVHLMLLLSRAFPATVHGSFLKLEVEIVASSLELLLVVIATRKVTNLLYV